MIIEDLKADLSEAAEQKIKIAIEQAVQKKLQKELKKLTKKLAKRFIITGVAVAGVLLLASNSDKIVNLIVKPKEQ